MKMFIITSVSEDHKEVASLMEKAGIKVYSVTETIGHKTEHHDHLSDNWFSGRNDDGTSAYFYYSFTDNEHAARAMDMVKEFNKTRETDFPVRAFIVPVEASSH